MNTLIIKYQDIIPPPSDEEFRQLEQNILADGIRDPLVMWGNVLIDGHNRYKIAQKHGLPFETKQIDFIDEGDARIWIISNQIGRRNIEQYVRGELVLELESLLKAQAKERQRGGQGGILLVLNSAQANTGRTRDNLAKMSGVSHSTIDQIKYIKTHGTDELKDKARKGEISIHNAYRQLKPRQNSVVPAPPKTDCHVSTATEKTCTICGRVLPIDRFYITNGDPKSACKQCTLAQKSYGISPNIREDIKRAQQVADYMTDTERVIEYSIEDVIMPIAEEFNRLIRIIDTETRNHADLMKNPGNKEALQKALEIGVSQIQDKIKNLAR